MRALFLVIDTLCSSNLAADRGGGSVLAVAFNVVNTRNPFVAMIGEFPLSRSPSRCCGRSAIVLPNLGGIDISPIILILIIIFIRCRASDSTSFPTSSDVASRPPWTFADGRVVIAVRLTPKGGRDAIDGIETLADGRMVLKARVRAAPSEGEANAALCRLLAKALGVPPRRVAIVRRGHVPHQAREDRCGDARGARRGAGEDRARAVIQSWRRIYVKEDHMRQGAIIDGKAIAQRRSARDKIARLAAVRSGSALDARPRAGARGGAGRRESGERRLCAHEVEADGRSRHALVRSQAAGRCAGGRAAGAGRKTQRRPGRARHPGAAAAAEADRQPEGAQRGRPRQGRGRLSSGQCRTARDRTAGAECRARRSAACMLAKTVHRSLEGMEAVVVGRSNIVGKPLAQLLLAENAP